MPRVRSGKQLKLLRTRVQLSQGGIDHPGIRSVSHLSLRAVRAGAQPVCPKMYMAASGKSSAYSMDLSDGLLYTFQIFPFVEIRLSDRSLHICV